MIFVGTDILTPYHREIISEESYDTLIDFLVIHYPDGFEKPTDVSVNGNEVKVEDFDIKLKEDDVIVFLDRTALPVGLIGGWFITALANLAISVTLSYIANKLFAPDAPIDRGSPSSVYNLNSAQNTARFGSPIPIIYGTVRAYPSMIVQPYYRFEDNVEYLYHVLCVGQGTLTTDEVLIGDDVVTNAGDFDWKLLYKDSFHDIPLKGYGIHLTKTLSVPSTIELKLEDGETEKYRVSSEAQYVEFDYMYPNGLGHYQNDGDWVGTSTSFTYKIYIKAGDNYYLTMADAVSQSGRTIDAIQKTKRIDVSEYPDDVYISFTKTSGYVSDKTTTHTYIKRVKEIHPNEDFTQGYGDITVLACKIKATDTISSRGQVQVNGYFTRTDVSNSMAEVLKDIYTNTTYGAGLNVNDLSFPATFETVDCAYDESMTIFDAMRKPAIAQAYSLYLAGMDVILKKDEATAVTTAMFNEKNILRNTFKAQYMFKEEYPSYDGFECTYIDGDGWVPKTAKYPANSTRPQRVDLFGVVDWSNAGSSYVSPYPLDLIVTCPVQPSVAYNGFGTTINYHYIGLDMWWIYSEDYMDPGNSFEFTTNKEQVTRVIIRSLTSPSAISMFAFMTALEEVDLSGFNAEGVKVFDNMFIYCSSLTSVDMSVIAASNPTPEDCFSMFGRCTSLQHVNLTGFDTSNVDRFDGMFAYDTSLACITNIDTTNPGAVKTNMFLDCDILAAPAPGTQDLITSTAGYDYVNSNPCPAGI